MQNIGDKFNEGPAGRRDIKTPRHVKQTVHNHGSSRCKKDRLLIRYLLGGLLQALSGQSLSKQPGRTKAK